MPSAPSSGLSPQLAPSDVQRRSPKPTVREEVYDYIIIGAGVAGSTLANRLTASREFRVLLLEAGQLDAQEDIITIPGLAGTAAGSKYNWNLTSSPAAGTGNRSIALPSGRGVGGGSLINQMVFVRGSVGDFDRWRHFTGNNIVSAARELGIRVLRDGSGGDVSGGFFTTHSQTPRNARSSARIAHYDVAAKRANLRLIQNAHVTKVQIERGRAIGVQFVESSSSTRRTIKARKEVIVSAGAIFSPQILQLSGIGDAKELKTHGVQSVVDLPAVGRNLQDHPLLVLVNLINSPLNGGNLSDPAFAAEMMAEYKSNRTGPYANPGGEFLMFLPTSNFSTRAPELYKSAQAQDATQFLPADTPKSVVRGYRKQHALLTEGIAADTQTPMEMFWSEGTMVFGAQHPFSRGSVKLVSNDPFDSPAVDPGYLSNPLDLAVMVDAFKFARVIVATEAISQLSPVEIVPGPGVSSDADIESYVRQNLATFAHYAGTCSVGPRSAGGVVDDTFRVYGVKNLRVVDASVIPLLPAAHTSSTVYALAEKAATSILRDVGSRSPGRRDWD
ncbi:hypothetical protein ACHAP9_006646 [Verticillium nonalfalfae]